VEVRQASLVARLRGGARAMTARGALALATIHGARCLGRQAEIGSLEPGKRADIALWRLDDPGRAGIADPVAALVLGPPIRAEAVLVDGTPVVEDGRLLTADPDELAASAAATALSP
jgi:cytosine/adenosine deaminase-related metal-dependent hydrolase